MSVSDYVGGLVIIAIVLGIACSLPAVLCSIAYYSANNAAWRKAKITSPTQKLNAFTWSVIFPILSFLYGFSLSVDKSLLSTIGSLLWCSFISCLLMYYFWRTTRGPALLFLSSLLFAAIAWAVLDSTRSVHGELSRGYSALAILAGILLWNAMHTFSLDLSVTDFTQRQIQDY